MSHGQRFFKKSILSYEEKCLSSVYPPLKTINDSTTSDGQPLAIGGSPLAISCPPKAIGDLPMKIMVSSVLEIMSMLANNAYWSAIYNFSIKMNDSPMTINSQGLFVNRRLTRKDDPPRKIFY